MSLDTYIVEGGVGKCVCFSSLLPKLAEKAGGPVQIVTPYIDVFANNPLVSMCFDENTIPLDHEMIVKSDNIYYSEPYKSNFVKGEKHLVEMYCQLHGVEFDVNMRPKMYTDRVKEHTQQWKQQAGVTGPYIVVQFTGGQSPLGWQQQAQYASTNPNRNYPPYFAQGIVNALLKQYPDHVIIDATLPNEPSYMGTIKCDQPFPVIHELLKEAKGFIGIDSSLQHFAAAAGCPGVVLWGNTRWTQFGWMSNKNMSFHDKNKFNTWYKMDIADPRNILVDPGDVMSTYINHVHGKKLQPVDVQVAHKK